MLRSSSFGDEAGVGFNTHVRTEGLSSRLQHAKAREDAPVYKWMSFRKQTGSGGQTCRAGETMRGKVRVKPEFCTR